MVIFINQIRMKIGVMFGIPETTTGGNALKFYASVRLDIRRIGAIKERTRLSATRPASRSSKNKVLAAVPRIDLRHPLRRGVCSRQGEIIDLGVQAKIVDKAGAWVQLQRRQDRPGQGQRA